MLYMLHEKSDWPFLWKFTFVSLKFFYEKTIQSKNFILFLFWYKWTNIRNVYAFSLLIICNDHLSTHSYRTVLLDPSRCQYKARLDFMIFVLWFFTIHPEGQIIAQWFKTEEVICVFVFLIRFLRININWWLLSWRNNCYFKTKSFMSFLLWAQNFFMYLQ